MFLSTMLQNGPELMLGVDARMGDGGAAVEEKGG